MDTLSMLRWWYATWPTHPYTDHLLSLVAGTIGSGVSAVVMTPTLKLPHIDLREGTFHLGFLGTLATGAVLALVVDIAFPIGIISGIIAPTVIEATNRTIIPGVANIVVKWGTRKLGDDHGTD